MTSPERIFLGWWGRVVLQSVRAAYLPLLFGICCVLFGCTVPLLKAELGGPTISAVVDHINCELASVMNTIIIDRDANGNPRYDKDGLPLYSINKESQNLWLKQRVQTDPRLGQLLAFLTEKHFVAAAQLTLDVLDTEGVNPSVNLITPFYPGTTMSTMYNYTLAVGGSLSGTQERNIGFGYSIDLEMLLPARFDDGRPAKSTVARDCQNRYGVADENGQLSAPGGIGGDLGLTSIIVDGLAGLDAASQVNVYGSTGPVPPTTTLRFGGDQNPPAILTLPHGLYEGNTLSLVGSITVTPPTTDPHGMGSATLAAYSTTNNAFINLSGSALFQFDQSGDPKKTGTINGVTLALTGSLQFADNLNNKLGLNPKLNLSGAIKIKDDDYTLENNPKFTGVILPDATTVTESQAKYCQTNDCTAALQLNNPRNPSDMKSVSAFGASPTPGSGGTPSKGAGSGATGSTQFSSYVNFIISYGLNGGPNWTLKTFKGPSGGGGGGGGGSSGGSGGGQLLSATRTDTDSLTITFVAACQDKQKLVAKTYWDTLPTCDNLGILKAGAATTATQYNILSVTGKAQY